jgi:hypothetical protein
MPLYTFVMDFMGGTYMAQVRGGSVRSACLKWAKTIEVSEIHGLGPSGQAKLHDEMGEPYNTPVPLTGLSNAWCTGALIRGRGALINIVRTDEHVVEQRGRRLGRSKRRRQ